MKDNLLNFTVLIEQDEDGMYVAKVPDIPGCYTQGNTITQAMERIEEAIHACIDTGEDLTEIVPMKFIGLQQIEIKVKA
ncbi:type II toxin-antitoxin system HicB family antitoxin [Methanomicrobium antiquum]|uniref:Type II toxin-antitoxin system HicB family antitoxin n=1 Tax=Methanomicrobium antiquum TaxID=487686 RepID=A0AAF0FVE4_9EURY|nr:type II toxin-antitoxin system HicB family antitoxin [Methanomicrobium antiquum]WFN37133.1 type II toxin-antitoxin system HicB family antitoxin [Methanomicrobium antiquum]